MNPFKTMMDILSKNNLDGYIIYNTDEHLNEYINAGDRRIEYLTGFSGSNATLVILRNENFLYTDARYFIQAELELKNGFRLMKAGIDKNIADLAYSKIENGVLGIDKNYISQKKFLDLKSRLEKLNVKLVHHDISILNRFWPSLPKREFKEVIDMEKICLQEFMSEESLKDISMPEKLVNNITGFNRRDKIENIRKFLKDEQAIIITELDSIAWLFNLRGCDIEYNPVFYSFAYIDKTSVKLFLNYKIMIEDVEVRNYDEFYVLLNEIKDKDINVSGMCNAFLAEKLKSPEFVSFLNESKSIKNSIELAGFKKAHIMDGYALTSLFGWLEKNLESQKLCESDVGKKLVEIKSNIKGYKGESFEAICGYGKNSAIIHHRSGSTHIGKDSIILLDSGSQYLFGTTDVTRVLHFGVPNKEQKETFTRVLKGNLRARSLIWSKNMYSNVVDSIARIDMWKSQEDFGHATSHGVGHFLNVHEDPPTFGVGYHLKPGQVMSIEPGLYKKDKLGVRIEDLVIVKKLNEKYYKFETLTCVPLQLNLIDVNMLNNDEIEQINNYSAWVRSNLEVLLKEDLGYEWLVKNTTKISMTRSKA